MNVNPLINDLVKQYEKLMAFITRELFMVGKYDPRAVAMSKVKIDMAIVKTEKYVHSWAKKNIPFVYDSEFNRADKELKKISGNKPKNVDKQKKKDKKEYTENVIMYMHRANISIKKMTDQFFKDLKYAKDKLNSEFKKIISIQNLVPDTTDMNKAVERIIKDVSEVRVRPWGQGTKKSIGTIGQARKSLLDWFKKQYGDINFVAIEGKDGIIRHYKPDYYAQMVARTELTNAQVQGVIEANRKWNNDLVIVSSHFNACPICIPYEGQIYSLSGKHPFYPAALDLPPYHVHCAHGIDPITDTVAYIQDKEGLLTEQHSKMAQRALMRPTKKVKTELEEQGLGDEYLEN